MNEAEIRKYARLMQELGLTGLEVKENLGGVRLERAGAASPAVMTAAAPAVQDVPAAPTSSEVRSPMVGIFYAAPAEDAEPFVEVGRRVKKGDTLCVIEAMKLMNEITAEQDGTIVEICAQNGQAVEYGTPLFRYEEG